MAKYYSPKADIRLPLASRRRFLECKFPWSTGLWSDPVADSERSARNIVQGSDLDWSVVVRVKNCHQSYHCTKPNIRCSVTFVK